MGGFCYILWISFWDGYILKRMTPLVLQNEIVTLTPLVYQHESALIEATKDGELWKLWMTTIPHPSGMKDYITWRLSLQESGRARCFVVIKNDTQKIVGCTNYLNIDTPNRRLEIGGTWYAQKAQKSPINTNCKLLLLTHAFETLSCIAVEFRTHVLNEASRKAIERLGAKQDGILRQHQILPNGTLRDTAVYSILDSEWPIIKSALINKKF